jgi:hypothetical protein
MYRVTLLGHSFVVLSYLEIPSRLRDGSKAEDFGPSQKKFIAKSKEANTGRSINKSGRIYKGRLWLKKGLLCQ